MEGDDLIVIVDFGMGNLKSIQKALMDLNVDVQISGNPSAIEQAERLILPGVGAFADGMRNLRSLGLEKTIYDLVLNKKRPILGICLGMQLLATKGSEGGETAGLNILPGEVVRLENGSAKERIPHVGWNEVSIVRQAALFAQIPDKSDFYFSHSYHLKPYDKRNIVGTTQYCGHFVSTINSDNIWGVQFHPEKSGPLGKLLLKNFMTC
jgi:glutamine amidotransferase